MPAYESFTLGGPMRLSGYRVNQFSGNQYAFGRLMYYRKTINLPDILGSGVDREGLFILDQHCSYHTRIIRAAQVEYRVRDNANLLVGVNQGKRSLGKGLTPAKTGAARLARERKARRVLAARRRKKRSHPRRQVRQ